MRSKSASDNSRNIQRRFDGFGGGGGLYNVAKSEDDKIFNDPSFGDQWYMVCDQIYIPSRAIYVFLPKMEIFFGCCTVALSWAF